MISLALTGGIACGKSELGRILERLGAEVVDADAVVRRLHQPGGEAARIVAEKFGEKYLLPDGSTDRSRLAQAVFADENARRSLENALHPIVRKWLLDWKCDTKRRASVRIAQIPLLFESDWSRDWDRTATVETTDIETRLARLAGRGLSREAALARIGAQLPTGERVAKADFVVFNNAGKEQLGELARILLDSLNAEA